MITPEGKQVILYHEGSIGGHAHMHVSVAKLSEAAIADLKNLTTHIALKGKLVALGDSAQKDGLSGEALYDHQKEAVLDYNAACAPLNQELREKLVIDIASIIPPPPPEPES